MLYGFKIRWLNIRDEWYAPKTRGLRMGGKAVGNGIVGESVGESVGDNAADVNTDVGIESWFWSGLNGGVDFEFRFRLLLLADSSSGFGIGYEKIVI